MKQLPTFTVFLEFLNNQNIDYLLNYPPPPNIRVGGINKIWIPLERSNLCFPKLEMPFT